MRESGQGIVDAAEQPEHRAGKRPRHGISHGIKEPGDGFLDQVLRLQQGVPTVAAQKPADARLEAE
jgi:hypothetical protein